MDIKELQDYRLSDAVKFHDTLNPKIWGSDEHLLPEVREKLMAIADDFKEFLGLDLEVKDITISGSNASYTYSDYSDIDLHLVADLPKADLSEIYRELFDAKKYQYNDQHNFKIGGYDVELYVQNANEEPKSNGIYSVLNNDWIKVPARRKPTVNDESVKSKYEDIGCRIDAAIESGDSARLEDIAKKVRAMRQSGLEQTGEFGPENLAFKVLRSNGTLEKLRTARMAAKDRELSIAEAGKKKQRFKYGFSSNQYWEPGFDYYSKGATDTDADFESAPVKEGVDDINTQLQNFVKFCAEQLKLSAIPKIQIKRDPAWSERNNSFGRYEPDSDTLILSIANRHPLDIMRTMAHELTHRKQDEKADMPVGAGETGSKWENDANARAGILMRKFAELHPEYFAKEPISEASGYIPVNDREARDPRYSMALTVDIKPGENQRQAAKMGWKTNPAGTPPTAKTNGLVEALTRRLQLVKEGFEPELEEVAMSPGSLKSFANSPEAAGMMAGFEAELIFAGIGEPEESEPEWEPDYDQDTRANSIDEIIEFFQSGDFADLSDRQADRIRSDMENDYNEWLYEKMGDDWDREQEDFIRDYLVNMEGLEGEELEQRVAAAIEEQNRDYDNAQEEFDDDWRSNTDLDESDWLSSQGIRYMTDAERAYDFVWPYLQDVNYGAGGEGGFSEASAQRLADDLTDTLDVKTTVSGGYHSAKRDATTWIFEPDSSLEASDSEDMPVEIVSPPMPLKDALEMLPKFFDWAESNGAYANKSTGFHMSVSMPDHSGNALDYVKLALFLGDEYVLKQFGREANTYTASAISKIRAAAKKPMVKEDETQADAVLAAMRKHLNQFAARAVAQPSGFGKYTSINPKTNYIEFRSAGGSDYFRDMDKIQNTLMRYARATSLAMNPEAEKAEYAKKLYKLLTNTETQQVTDPKTGRKRTEVKGKVDNDAISIFSRYVAGELPQSALKSFLKQLQYSREVEKNPSSEKIRWRVTHPNGNTSVEVSAATKTEAIRLAKQEYNDTMNPDGAYSAMPLTQSANLSQTDIENRLGWGSQVADANYEIVDLRNRTTPVFKLIANTEAEADQKLEQWLAVTGEDPAGFAVRRIQPPATQTPASDQMTAPAADDPRGNYVLRRREGNEGTGAVLYRFSAPNNAAAVEAARQWTTARGLERRSVWLDHISGVPPEVLNARSGQSTSLPSQTDVENRLALGDQTADANYEIVDNRTEQSVFKFIANTIVDAARRYRQWLEIAGLPAGSTDYGLRRLPPRSPVQSEPQNFPAAQQPAGQFTGEWQVLDGLGREIYRFSGAGNNQGDANRIAAQWTQRSGVDGTIEVYPVMR